MIKIFLIIINLGLGALTSIFSFSYAWYFHVLISLGFAIGYLLIEIIIFFISAYLIGLPIKKDEIATKYSPKYRKIYDFYVSLALSLFGVYVVVNGLDKLPRDTNFVIVQNHLSNIDPMLSSVVFKNYPLIFISKESLFHIPFFGKYISRIGYIKLKRKACKEDVSEMKRAHEWIQNNECSIALYPEGQRNKNYPNPKLLDFKDGGVGLAKSSHKPLVISTIQGTEKINDKLLLKIHKIQIDILDVISEDEIECLPAKEINDRIINTMLSSIENKSSKDEYHHLF